MKKSITSRLPRFSAFLLLFSLPVYGVQTLPAGVQFGTFMDGAGDFSVFRFTIKVPQSGDLIRTIFPSNVIYWGDPSNLDICQENDDFMETNPIQNCSFDLATNMAEFLLPDHISPPNFFTYELGFMQNPAYSQDLQGFDIQVLDSTSPDTVLY
jgi:hypothetical protein